VNAYSVRRFRESGQEYEFFASLLSRAKPGRRAATIETSNEEDSPMFALNLKLGFKPKPAWIDYSRDAFK
jgi:hypothetical protein